MQKLGQNDGGYRGETIDIAAVQRDIHEAARRHGWRLEAFPANENLYLHAATRLPASTFPPRPPWRLYISTGIHGDEPAGPLAVRRLLQENQWPAGAEIWLCPCLNPTGFVRKSRENERGIDLNRDYRHLQTDEVRAHVGWLNRQPAFDLALCLHEDWEAHGFYVYELNPDHRPSHAEAIISQVAAVCPIDRSEMIEGRPARNGIIRPELDPDLRPQWPEAFYLVQHKTRHSYTLEAPSDFSLSTREAALVTAVRAVLDACLPKAG